MTDRDHVELPPYLGDLSDAKSFANLRRRYEQARRADNYSEHTIRMHAYAINHLTAWSLERGIDQARNMTPDQLERYKQHLLNFKKRNGHPLSASFRAQIVTAVRCFFRYLSEQNHILYNVAADLKAPKIEDRLPKAILTQEEAEAILAEPDLKTPTGVRDRAILEVFYSTGMRRKELVNLNLGDIDFERGTVMIRQGKGSKDRLIPIGERAIAWVQKYLEEIRPLFVESPTQQALFLIMTGESLIPNHLGMQVRRYIQAAEIGKTGSCHIFRHTAATLMLESGADIRFIQQLLGHKKLETTEVYTRVSIQKLKEVHTNTHPGANLNRPKPEEQ